MSSKIKYRIRSRPRRIKKIAKVIIAIGATLAIIGDYIITPIINTLPLELWIFLFAEIVPIALAQFWILGILILSIGILLLNFNWYKGTALLNTSDEAIYLSGKISTFIEIKDVNEINLFPNNVMNKNSIRFDSLYDRISVKFSNKNELVKFFEQMVPILNKHENVAVNNWEH